VSSPSLPDHLRRNQDELARISEVVTSGRDHPVLMLNENAYTHDAAYPHGELYQRYVAGLEALVTRLGGQFLWQLPVLGQPVGAGRAMDEIIAIWYPSHKAYLDLPSAEGGDENYRLRTLCVERARIHRCPG
jgi:hypothetical protein